MIVFFWKIASKEIIGEIIVETSKMDQENTDIAGKEASSNKQMELFGNPGYCGHMCSGTQSHQVTQVLNCESQAPSNQTISIYPHPDGGELDGLGQISVPSSCPT